MDIIQVKDGDCIVLESKKDLLVIHGKDGKIHYRIILKDYKATETKASMRINDEGGLTVEDREGKVLLDIRGDTSYNKGFKCPNHPTFITECDIGYACDACPYNPDLRENYKGVKVKW
jgi:hypothetical protein